MGNWKQEKKLIKKYPWLAPWRNLQHRVLPGYRQAYMYYDIGVQNRMTRDELRDLWDRDRAYNMDRPCLHRKENKGHYEFTNCEFIEFNEHSRRHVQGKTEKGRRGIE